MRAKRRTTGEDAGGVIGAAQIVEAMERFGASFYFRPGGSLLVRNLANLPAALIDQFLNCNGAEMVAVIRGRQARQTAGV